MCDDFFVIYVYCINSSLVVMMYMYSKLMHVVLEYLVFLLFTGMDRIRSHFIPGSLWRENRYTAKEI